MKKLIIIALLLAAGNANASGWEFSQRADPMTDAVKSYATVESIEKGGMLAARCMNNEFDVLYISDGQYFPEESFVVTVRVDKEKPIKLPANGIGAKILFMSTPAILADMAKKGNKLLIGVTAYSENSSKVRAFSLKGATAAITKVEAACK
ncbi:hypothetical protein DRN75_00895 [Nanoarchaeota archaeon]|nr:MAG: hypothetical protein DRN75_00895 [Nanoarchaeota archaeon]